MAHWVRIVLLGCTIACCFAEPPRPGPPMHRRGLIDGAYVFTRESAHEISLFPICLDSMGPRVIVDAPRGVSSPRVRPTKYDLIYLLHQSSEVHFGPDARYGVIAFDPSNAATSSVLLFPPSFTTRAFLVLPDGRSVVTSSAMHGVHLWVENATLPTLLSPYGAGALRYQRDRSSITWVMSRGPDDVIEAARALDVCWYDPGAARLHTKTLDLAPLADNGGYPALFSVAEGTVYLTVAYRNRDLTVTECRLWSYSTETDRLRDVYNWRKGVPTAVADPWAILHHSLVDPTDVSLFNRDRLKTVRLPRERIADLAVGASGEAVILTEQHIYRYNGRTMAQTSCLALPF